MRGADIRPSLFFSDLGAPPVVLLPLGQLLLARSFVGLGVLRQRRLALATTACPDIGKTVINFWQRFHCIPEYALIIP